MDFTKDIYINKEIISENSEIVLLYKGFLFSNNLTNEVYISYGYGNLWNNKQEIKMKPSTFGYLATINIENGENLQFCFKNDRGTWDNNNGQNYILPIQESEEVLSFKTLPNTQKEIDLEINTVNSTTNTENNETENILEASVVSSNNIDFYQTINLENITKQVIPNSTTFTKITTNENTENIVSNSVIKSEEVKENTSVTFSELTEKAKEQSVKAFDDNNVTAGSVYVNSIVKDIQEVPKILENITDKETTSLITTGNTDLKTPTFFETFISNIKLAFGKVVKLVKTTFNLNEDNDNN